MFRFASELTEVQLKRATEVDPEREVALVVTIGSGAEETIIAGGRYIAAAHDATTAEVAFLVEEDYQGLGIIRSLGRRRVPVCVVDDERSIGRFSRYTTHAVKVADLRGPAETRGQPVADKGASRRCPAYRRGRK